MAVLTDFAYEVMADEPGARLERERPGWYLTMKREPEPKGGITLEARNQVSDDILEEHITSDEFEAALRERSQFVNVMQRAVASLIRRIPLSNGCDVCRELGFLCATHERLTIQRDGSGINAKGERRSLGDRLRAAAKSIRNKPAMTEGEFLVEAGRRGGKSTQAVFFGDGSLPFASAGESAGTYMGISRSTWPEFRADGIRDLIQGPVSKEPQPLMPRPARSYFDD